MNLRIAWQTHRSRLGLFGLFTLIVACYGMFAAQGTIPLMSPDETASFAFARHMGQAMSPTISEPRAVLFSWLHPRSFVAQQGALLPVGFPLWMTILSLVGWIGSGEAIMWATVLISASCVFPLVGLLERVLRFSRGEALATALAVMALPTMIIYGNRSLFTLVPQLSLLCWALWLTQRSTSERGAGLAGIVGALAIGMRPVEIVWMAPLLGAMAWMRARELQTSRRWSLAWIVGLCLGVGIGAFVHVWVYGSLFSVGYLLRDTPAIPVSAVAGEGARALAWWRAFFPYGFSFHQWQQNLRGAWTMGWWPWMVVWIAAAGTWLRVARTKASRLEMGVTVGLGALTLWLSFYYGQGRFIDSISGQLFHLGNSLFRYQTPVMVAWMIWSFWIFRTYLTSPWNRRLMFVLAIGSTLLGGLWAWNDPQDGLRINREQRLEYARIRELVTEKSDPQTIWLSERSDKMIFPLRAVAFIQQPSEIKRFLQTQKQPVWLFRRPPSQKERDLWYAEGLELVAQQSFARETIYEVRLRSGY